VTDPTNKPVATPPMPDDDPPRQGFRTWLISQNIQPSRARPPYMNRRGGLEPAAPAGPLFELPGALQEPNQAQPESPDVGEDTPF